MEKDPEDLILEWCALEDFHSGGMVYEQDRPEDQPQDQSDEEFPPAQSVHGKIQHPQKGKQKGKEKEPESIEIDPMDPATLGSARVRVAQGNMEKNGYQCPAEVLQPLISATAFYDRCVMIGPKPKPCPRKDTRVPQKNVKDLKDWGLLLAVTIHAIVCFAMLFTVPKPTGLHRSTAGRGTLSSLGHRILSFSSRQNLWRPSGGSVGWPRRAHGIYGISSIDSPFPVISACSMG